MTTKAKVLAMIQRLDEDVTYDDVLYELGFMKHVEQGLNEADQGLGMDDDEFMAQLEAEDAADLPQLDANGAKRPSRDKGAHRTNGTKKRPQVRTKAQGGGKKA